DYLTLAAKMLGHDRRALPGFLRRFAADLRKLRQNSAREALFTAVYARFAALRHQVVFKQELLLDRHVDVVPRENLVHRAWAMRIKVHAQAVLLERLPPGFRFMLLVPGVELIAKLPGSQ